MALTSTTALGQMRVFLMDAGSLVWADGDLTGAQRMALGEFSLRHGTALTLSGLDGASSTTLPAIGEQVFILGACAYAALGRSIDRAEAYELANEGSAVKEWGTSRLKEFWTLLGVLYPAAAVTGEAGTIASEHETAETARWAARNSSDAAIAAANQTAESGRATAKNSSDAAMAAAGNASREAVAEGNNASREAIQTAADAARLARQEAGYTREDALKAAEDARKAELRGAAAPPWGKWEDDFGEKRGSSHE